MQVKTAISQIVSTLSTRNKSFECSVYANHYWIRYDNDHHVAQTDGRQMSSVVHVCYEKHTYLVLNLNQKETQDCGDRQAHKLLDGLSNW